MTITFPPRFVWGWPSWIVEQLGAGVAVGLALLVTREPGLVGAIATALSAIYERFLDRNGWSWADVGEREVGILALAILEAWLR